MTVSATATSLSPTVSELLNAANWEYDQVGTPADLAPLLVGGQQLTFTSTADGISAAAWLTPQHQVVISYEGTQAISLAAFASNPAFTFQQIVEDSGVAQGLVTPGESDALTFAHQVVSAASSQGITAANVFVTGHSLGGIQAEYVAQQTGLGGVAFESTGLPRSSTDAGTGSNFVNVVQYGDAVANYSSDIAAEQPFAPAYSPGGTGALPHYGYVAMIGDPAAEPTLVLGAQPSRAGAAGVAVTSAAYGANIGAWHIPGVQAYNLGVTLTQDPPADNAGVRSGPVLNAANDTIAQLIAATHATLSAALPPATGVSPTSGAYSGEAAVLLAQNSSSSAQLHALIDAFAGAGAGAPTLAGEGWVQALEGLYTSGGAKAEDLALLTAVASDPVITSQGVDHLSHATLDASLLAVAAHIDTTWHLL